MSIKFIFKEIIFDTSLYQIIKIFHTNPGLANNIAESAPVKLFMVWHRNLCEWIIAAENYMTAMLPLEIKTYFR
jgi:hypothetical protein